MWRVWWLLPACILFVCRCQQVIDVAESQVDSSETLECHRKLYTYRVTQTDENGKQCWDTVSALACWGRCDSNEVKIIAWNLSFIDMHEFQISDWRFPYKKSSHPVCVHYGRNKSLVYLRHCEDGALPSASRYEYLEASGCRCQLCSSSDTSCEGLRYRPHRSHPEPDLLGFTVGHWYVHKVLIILTRDLR